MEKITSFTIDHLRLLPGLYVSRKDKVGSETVTTFDLRLTRPNFEPVMNTAEIHAMEHLGATYLRNHPQWKERVLYFGPMGCRTGFYLLLAGDYESRQVLELVTECFRFIANYNGEIPGASAKDCGNYLDLNLPMANYWADHYVRILEQADESRLVYPE
jgi:S-ribosylhomocysteine lyase